MSSDRLLFIYDAAESDFVDDDTKAKARATLAIKQGRDELLAELGNLVSRGETFDRALIFTHGGPGRIFFKFDKTVKDDYRIIEHSNIEKHFLIPNQNIWLTRKI